MVASDEDLVLGRYPFEPRDKMLDKPVSLNVNGVGSAHRTTVACYDEQVTLWNIQR